MVCNISKTSTLFIFLGKPGVIFTNKTKEEEGIQKKLRFSLSLIKHHALGAYGAAEVFLHTFLTTALHGGEQTAPCHRGFAISTHGIWSWVGPRASLDARKNNLYFNTKQVINNMPKILYRKYSECGSCGPKYHPWKEMSVHLSKKQLNFPRNSSWLITQNSPTLWWKLS